MTEWEKIAVVAVVIVAGTFGVVKVMNELDMTRAYDRQAAALERLADVAERENPKPLKLRATCR